jgi:hypothetical protein
MTDREQAVIDAARAVLDAVRGIRSQYVNDWRPLNTAGSALETALAALDAEPDYRERMARLYRGADADAGRCHLCGSEVGPDITGRPMCYGCGPKEMIPEGVPSYK